MARASATKVYRTFTAGLITEASPLTYPENASLDELNCVITRKGNRRRRRGIDLDIGFSNTSFSVDTEESQSYHHNNFVWNSVSNDSEVSFLVTQIGSYLRFFDISDGLNYPTEKSFFVDLSSFVLDDIPISLPQIRVSMDSGRGALFVTGKYLDPFYVEYDKDGDLINTTRVQILIRDFVGLDDTLSPSVEPTTLTDEHKYNLMNQGWVDTTDGIGSSTVSLRQYDPFGTLRPVSWSTKVITDYHTANSRYPSNSQVWWLGKDSNNAFDPAELIKVYFGGSRASRGFFVINAMLKNRAQVSGISGLLSDVANTRPSDVGFFAGRTWWAHDNDVYFSQVLEDVRQCGNCYQEADPTSETVSDLIDSDGGQIPIPEALNIHKLVPYGSGMLAFAENGVWHIRATDSGFTARDYSVDKVSSIGLEGPDSVVVAGQNIFWWSKLGIQGLSQSGGLFGPIAGSFETSNISESTIQTFLEEELTVSARFQVKGHYDPTSNTVQWLFSSPDSPGITYYDRILNYDLSLNAFYPWTVSSAVGRPYLIGAYLSQDINDARRNRLSRYIVVVPKDDPEESTFGFATFRDEQFADWKTFEGSVGYPFESRLIAGYELMDDTMRLKELSHIQTYFNKTETTYIDEGNGDYSVDKPSSCKFRVRWDWADDPVSGNWTREVEAYQHGRLPPVDPSDLTFRNGSAVVATKHKVRGHGRSIQFEFRSSKIGHDFDLLGWAVLLTGNTLP